MAQKNKIKKYRVSLACTVYCNFEQKIDAKDEKEALKIAVKKYNIGDYDIEADFTEPNWTHHCLDIKPRKPNDLDSGVYIEELTK